jgi:hypothetical protein
MEPAEAVTTSFLNGFVSLSGPQRAPTFASRSIAIAVSVIDCRRLRSLEAWLSLNSLDINARYQQ